jgi:hypothetical protein
MRSNIQNSHEQSEIAKVKSCTFPCEGPCLGRIFMHTEGLQKKVMRCRPSASVLNLIFLVGSPLRFTIFRTHSSGKSSKMLSTYWVATVSPFFSCLSSALSAATTTLFLSCAQGYIPMSISLELAGVGFFSRFKTLRPSLLITICRMPGSSFVSTHTVVKISPLGSAMERMSPSLLLLLIAMLFLLLSAMLLSMLMLFFVL